MKAIIFVSDINFLGLIILHHDEKDDGLYLFYLSTYYKVKLKLIWTICADILLAIEIIKIPLLILKHFGIQFKITTLQSTRK